ncbi:MAG: hypothetical protein IIA72_18195 [Proteobacteria bacterium]|nr:hypothetical protein [Pseudomonadota bacterium]
MAQPQETRRPPLRMGVESYVGVTGVTYAARADDRKDRMAELNTIP